MTTKGSNNPFPSVLLNEVATDGSDTGTPAADYRRLFLGEDGKLHLKDSAAAVTDVDSGSGSVATDAIWDAAGDLAVGSGANTAARLAMGAVGGAVGRVNGAVAWTGGTAFPTAATGDRFYRTDLLMEFQYDGTRWLCICPHVLPIPEVSNLSATGDSSFVLSPRATKELWLVKLQMVTLVLSANTGSAFWTVKLTGKVAPNTTTDVASASASTGTTPDTDLTWTPHHVTLGVALSSSYLQFYMTATKTSTPGNLYYSAALDFRYIG